MFIFLFAYSNRKERVTKKKIQGERKIMNNHIVMIKKFNIGVLGFIWTRVVTWR